MQASSSRCENLQGLSVAGDFRCLQVSDSAPIFQLLAFALEEEPLAQGESPVALH